MILQDFDPQAHTIDEFVAFCQRLEATESEPVPPKEDKPKRSRDNEKSEEQKHSAKHNKKHKKNNGKKWCPLHEDDSHDISECRVLLAQAEKMKANWKTQQQLAPRKPYGVKGQRKDGQQELNAMVNQLAEQKLASFTKKRKKGNDASYEAFANLRISGDSSDEEE